MGADSLRDLRSDAFSSDVPAALLLLHGYGSNEHDLPGLVPHLGSRLPWASLRAPIALGPGQASWFDILKPGDPDAAPVEAATDAIWDWVDANLAAATRVVPIGFSQGGLMASQLLRTRPDRVLAPVILSGFVLGHPQPADARLAERRPAAFYGRGDLDTVITPDAVERTRAWLPQHTTLDVQRYAGLAHSISVDELADVRRFLERELPAS